MAITPLTPPALPPTPPNSGEARLAARVGQDFEALLVTRLLKTARAAALGDDLLGNNAQVRDMIDEQRGKAIAAAAPIGLAQLLARETGR